MAGPLEAMEAIGLQRPPPTPTTVSRALGFDAVQLLQSLNFRRAASSFQLDPKQRAAHVSGSSSAVLAKYRRKLYFLLSLDAKGSPPALGAQERSPEWKSHAGRLRHMLHGHQGPLWVLIFWVKAVHLLYLCYRIFMRLKENNRSSRSQLQCFRYHTLQAVWRF